MHLLVVEDNQSLVGNLLDFFEARGHQVEAAPDGVTGLHLAMTQPFDAMVLDLTLPRIDGMQVLQQIRRGANAGLPVLMLTARDELPDKVAGFEAGADDYLTKPFALAELLARLTALVARVAGQSRASVLQVADLVLDPGTLQVTRAGKPLHLYRGCLKLLEVLMQASPAAVPRERLEQALWGDSAAPGDMLRSHIYELRRSVDGPFEQKLIQTLPRVGYRIVDTRDAVLA